MDSQPSPRFRLLHIGDTMMVLDPATLGGRLERAGFADVSVRPGDGTLAFHAHKSPA